MNININKVKLVVMIPVDNMIEVRQAILESECGIIGNYSHCSIVHEVEGTFMPNDKANPFIGSSNQLEFVKEMKLEVVCDIDKVKEVLKLVRKVHPYEEIAIDIIPLIDENIL